MVAKDKGKSQVESKDKSQLTEENHIDRKLLMATLLVCRSILDRFSGLPIL